MPSVRRSFSHGFTLLELMVVLMIASLMLAIIPPILSGAGITTELRGSARQMAAGLRSARNHAITKKEEAIVTVNLENRQFTVTGDTRTGYLPDDDDVKIRLYTAQSELVDEEEGKIRFFPDGSSTGGYVALSDDRVEYRVNVDWLTGRIVIEDRDPEL